MSLDVKKAEILKLDEKARAKEAALKKSQMLLDEDVTRFDTFLQVSLGVLLGHGHLHSHGHSKTIAQDLQIIYCPDPIHLMHQNRTPGKRRESA